jgi:hypothetical protein
LEGVSSQPTSRSSSFSSVNINSEPMVTNDRDLLDVDDREAINSILNDANNDIFKDKVFKIENKEVKHSPIWLWFKCQTVFLTNEEAKKQINYKCIECGKTGAEYLSKPGNLKKHLKTDKHSENVHIWIKKFEDHKNLPNPLLKLDSKMLNLVKFFINSNVAVVSLRDKYLRKCFNFKLGKYSFQKKILPSLLDLIFLI